jgi:hypothetical protein
LGVGVMNWLELAKDKSEIQRQISVSKAQLSKLVAPSASTLDARQSSAMKAAALLQFDLNAVFASIENVKEPGIRLRNMSLDVSAGSIRLEYELDFSEKAVVLTRILNEGNSARPWKFESLNTENMGSSNPLNGLPKMVGIWNARIKDL